MYGSNVEVCASFTKSERPFNSLFFVDVSTEDFIERINDGNYVVAFFIFTLKRLMGKPKNIKIENIDTEKDHKSLQSLQRIYSLYMTDTIFPRFIKTYSMKFAKLHLFIHITVHIQNKKTL